MTVNRASKLNGVSSCCSALIPALDLVIATSRATKWPPRVMSTWEFLLDREREFVSLGPREASASALSALSATPPLARTASQVVRVPFADLHEVLHHDVGHQVVQRHLRLPSSDLHGAVLEDVLDGRLLEPVAVVGDGGLDDARERDVVLGVSQEQVPAVDVHVDVLSQFLRELAHAEVLPAAAHGVGEVQPAVHERVPGVHPHLRDERRSRVTRRGGSRRGGDANDAGRGADGG
mmetsp:Transcript_5149/g.19366  ORF Transcript_5149/g.19366 Transcript_5149/m.19366 type:complete len:235 (+) Transcript_5149:600-1304(+)